MRNSVQKFKAHPIFLWLLPLFFALHGYNQSPLSFSAGDFLGFLGRYTVAAAGLFLLHYWLFRNRLKAAIFSFVLLFIFLYFGPILDALKNVSTGFFLAKYSILLPALLAGLIALFLFFKKTDLTFKTLTLYLNVLLFALLLVEIPVLFQSKKTQPSIVGLQASFTGNKPNVYLLIADEYPDSSALAETFQFNNGEFLSGLRDRGFFVNRNTKGNYNFTPYAVASLLGMDYLPMLKGNKTNLADLNVCFNRINENALLRFFQNSGYEVRNFSIFNVADQEPQAKQGFVLLGAERLAAQTMLARLKKDLGYHLVSFLKDRSTAENDPYYTKHCNDTLLNLFYAEVQRKSSRPRFVYTHLLMPHPPYYNDSSGKERAKDFFTEENIYHKEGFRQYLQYSNHIFLNVIDAIFQNASTPPVILFMGDHGFRWYDRGSQTDNPNFYRNLNTVFLPGQVYDGFYEGISNVNQFRVLLNKAFGQHLPLLKDTTYFIAE